MTILELNEWSEEDIRPLLVGRRIVQAEEGDFPNPGGRHWRSASGKLTLDDGTEIFAIPNDGCGGCSNGHYGLTSLATVDNVITSVRLACESEDDEDEWSTDNSYRIYVVADAVEINALQVDGSDGNGYYGSGYELVVVLP